MKLRQTPFFDKHLNHRAKLVDFFGWHLPLHYGSQIKEHLAVRNHSGLFDVSHMTVIDLLGAGGRQFLRQLLSNDVDTLNTPGQSMYSLMLNEQGGIIDDLIVYYRAPDNYRLVLNAATLENDLQWLHQQAKGLSLGIQLRDELSMIAIQGPEAIQRLLKMLSPELMDACSTLKAFEAVDVGEWFIARTGYTGESGFEIISFPENLLKLWDQCIGAGIQPCGLGARDALRLEAGYLLYGQDMNENVNPYECGLGWTVSLRDPARDFIAKAALSLYREQDKGLRKHFLGVLMEERGMLRPGQPLLINGRVVGQLTSATFSPILDCSIGFARVHQTVFEKPTVQIRNKNIPVKLVKPRFIKAGQVIITEV